MCLLDDKLAKWSLVPCESDDKRYKNMVLIEQVKCDVTEKHENVYIYL